MWAVERQYDPKSEPEPFQKDSDELIAKMYLVKTCRLPAIEPAWTEIDDCKDALD